MKNSEGMNEWFDDNVKGYVKLCSYFYSLEAAPYPKKRLLSWNWSQMTAIGIIFLYTV